MIINHNMNALNAHRNMGMNTNAAGKSMEKLSSGLRINRAGDDAAGLAISEKMRGQIRGLDQASRNSQDGISLIQTAEGALNETHNILQRMRELSVQGANDTNVSVDRTAIETELKQLTSEIDRISSQTQFNKQSILANTSKVNIQVGANSKQAITISLKTMSSSGLGITAASLKVTNTSSANTLTDVLDKAIEQVSTHRSDLGALQNRLEHTISNLNNTSENLTAAESRVRDVDMAKEMMNFSKNNILQQAAQAMLAQANQQPQGVLQLLR
ncbi:MULTISPECIES: flagellin [Clostridium]|uniref:flagellin N-terminal helical domain-containing protein n=2 Tax=Clostridiaceae TaxID=31979 RepID=UPI0018ABD9DA|nr:MULTISPECIES: flagellin [Clostridium]MBS5883218.1 flagellin [Clostridium sp.]MDB1968464.1 flagellin [Clostridium tertium]MDU1277288.1 flagellin [Clostridium sp.]MDU1565571.1 flagellin [Clostridium sp.]MDU4739504.1 flagellin [Clostridium sp.]